MLYGGMLPSQGYKSVRQGKEENQMPTVSLFFFLKKKKVLA